MGMKTTIKCNIKNRVYYSGDLSGDGSNAQYQLVDSRIAPQGSICKIVDFVGKIYFMKLKTKSVAMTWKMIYTRILFNTEDVEQQHEILKKLTDLIDDGIIKITLSKTLEGFTVENMKKAHEMSESGKTIGKIAISFN